MEGDRIWSTGKAIHQRLSGGALSWQVKLACYVSVWFTKEYSYHKPAETDQSERKKGGTWRQHLRVSWAVRMGSRSLIFWPSLWMSVSICPALTSLILSHHFHTGSSHASSGSVFWVRREWDRENLVFQRCQCLCRQLYFSLGLATLSSLIRSW